MTRQDAFFICRTEVLYLRRLEDALKAANRDGRRSPALDGMPRGSGVGTGAAAIVERLDALRARVAAQRAKAEAARKRAEKYLPALDEGQRLFAIAYYLDGLSMQEAAEFCQRSERQCMRYKSMLFMRS